MLPSREYDEEELESIVSSERSHTVVIDMSNALFASLARGRNMNRILSSLLVTNEGAVIGVETGRVDLFMGHCSRRNTV